MKILSVSKDGGPFSRVWAYWLVEAKRLLSVALLRFEDGSRDAYHTHAFNSISWVLTGALREEHKDGHTNFYLPDWRPVVTTRDTNHKVTSIGRSWVLTVRGPWVDAWEETDANGVTRLTHGRKKTS